LSPFQALCIDRANRGSTSVAAHHCDSVPPHNAQRATWLRAARAGEEYDRAAANLDQTRDATIAKQQEVRPLRRRGGVLHVL
jgi:hypothetical protein